jgi:hypothetical protein
MTLDQTEDFVADFDRPGFYAVLEHVAGHPHSPGHTQTPIEVRDWRVFMERPNSLRGCPVTIEGIVGRNKAPYVLPRAPHLGEITQLELHRPDQPLACTVIVPQDASDIPVQSTIRLTGYFVLVRQYPDRSGHEQYAALLITPGPTGISRIVPGPAEIDRRWIWILGAIVVGLLVAILLLRRASRTGRRDVRTLRAAHDAPARLAEDLAAWADEEDPDTTSKPDRPPDP